MSARTRTRASAFLLCSLALLLAAGLYYRVAHPSLTLHLNHDPAPAATQADHDHPPLSPEATAELGRLMNTLREKPTDVTVLLAIADLFTRAKDWVNAMAFFDRAAETAPADMRPFYFRAVALAQKEDYPASAAAFERALELAPGNDAVRYNLAVLYQYHLAQPDKARTLFTAIAASPAASDALKQRARQELQPK